MTTPTPAPIPSGGSGTISEKTKITLALVATIVATLASTIWGAAYTKSRVDLFMEQAAANQVKIDKVPVIELQLEHSRQELAAIKQARSEDQAEFKRFSEKVMDRFDLVLEGLAKLDRRLTTQEALGTGSFRTTTNSPP